MANIALHNSDNSELFNSKLDFKFCIVTDPPFNVGYHYKNYQDNKEENEYYDWLLNILNIQDNPFIVIHYPEQLHKLSIRYGKAPEKVVSWVYNSNTAKQHRDIGFYNIKPDFRKVTQPYKNPNDKRIKERIARGIGGGRLYDWWNVNQVKNVSKQGISHPCVMPVEVMKNIIGIIPDDYVIIDPFMGSGTTGLACKELNRDFIGYEIDTEYFKEAERRLNG